LIIEQAGKFRAWMAFALLLVIVGNVLMRYVFDIESVALPLLAVDGDAYRRKPAEFIPNAAIWLGAVLSAQRSVAQPAVSTAYTYKRLIPFIVLQLGALTVVFLFPEIAIWLPKTIGWQASAGLHRFARSGNLRLIDLAKWRLGTDRIYRGGECGLRESTSTWSILNESANKHASSRSRFLVGARAARRGIGCSRSLCAWQCDSCDACDSDFIGRDACRRWCF
jgi:hypothetical protein